MAVPSRNHWGTRDIDILLGRTRAHKIRTATIGGAIVAGGVVLVGCALLGFMTLIASWSGGAVEFGIIYPNAATWCKTRTAQAQAMPAASLTSYILPSPTPVSAPQTPKGELDRSGEVVDRPSLPDVGHPSGVTPIPWGLMVVILVLVTLAMAEVGRGVFFLFNLPERIGHLRERLRDSIVAWYMTR